jgi:hypothetical protein
MMLATGLVACGSGDDTTTGAGTDTGAGTTTGTTGGGGTPAEVLACIQGAGLKAISSPGNTAVGITDSIKVAVPPSNAIIIDFFTDPGKAKDYSENQAVFLEGAGGGSSEVVGGTTVVGVARSGAEQELSTVKGCLGS